MFKKTMLTCAATILPFMASADIILDGWGTSASVVSMDDCPSYCTGNLESTEDGAVNQQSSYTELSNVAGTGRASAEINGSGYTPVLKAVAASNPNTGLFSSAWGIQHYTYTGSESITLELNLNLHGDVTGEGQVKGEVAIIKGDDIPWTGDMATLIYELVPYENVLGHDTIFLNENSGSTGTSTISVNLEAGDTFFVRADLSTNGKREGIADAYNTFTMSFSDDSQLQPASNPDVGNGPDEEVDYETRLQLIKTLWKVAYEDERFTRKEKRTVRRAARLLELNRGDVRMLKLEVKAEALAPPVEEDEPDSRYDDQDEIPS